MRKTCLVLLFLIIGFLLFTPTLIFAQHSTCGAGFPWVYCGPHTCTPGGAVVEQWCCPSCDSPDFCEDRPACPGYTEECTGTDTSTCSFPDCPGGYCAEMACINNQCISDCVPCESVTPTPTPTATPGLYTCQGCSSNYDYCWYSWTTNDPTCSDWWNPSKVYTVNCSCPVRGNPNCPGGNTSVCIGGPTPTPTPGGPTPTPTPPPYVCVPSAPSEPRLRSPKRGEVVETTTVPLRWREVLFWGRVCVGETEPHYKAYLDTQEPVRKNYDIQWAGYDISYVWQGYWGEISVNGQTLSRSPFGVKISVRGAATITFTVGGTFKIDGKSFNLKNNDSLYLKGALMTLPGGQVINLPETSTITLPPLIPGGSKLTIQQIKESSNLKCYIPYDPSRFLEETVYICPVSGLLEGVTYWWLVEADNGQLSTDSPTWWFTVGAPGAEGWFQTQEGDVHGQGNIRSKIPSTASEKYFSLNGSGGYPGVVSYTGTANFGSGSVSAPPAEWLAETSFPKKSYNYFYQLLGSPTYILSPGEIDVSTLETGVYAYEGNVSLPNAIWVVGTKKIVILTTGKFLIQNKIAIDTANGGSLVVIAKGDIGVRWNLTVIGQSGPGNNRLQGIFITDGTFYSSVDPVSFLSASFLSVDSNQILVIDGGVIAGGVNLKRDFEALGGGDYENETTPTETFRYDPSLFMNIHPDLWKSAFTWEELAP